MEVELNLRDAADRWESFLRAPNRRWRLVLGTLGGLFALANIFFWNWMTGKVWGPLVIGLRVLKDEPMGYASLVLVVILLASIVMAFIDTSPNAAVFGEWLNRPRKPRRALSLEEKEQIQKVRYFWRKGVYASDAFGNLLNRVVYDLKKTNTLAAYLEPVLASLGDARNAMETAVENESVLSLDEIRSCLNELFDAYLNAYRLLIHIDNLMPVSVGPYKSMFEAWQTNHAVYRAKLDELYERPEHGERLKTWRNFKEPDFLPRTPPVEPEGTHLLGDANR